MCEYGKDYHYFRIDLECLNCGREISVKASRPCKAPKGSSKEEKRVGCKKCHKSPKSGYTMYFYCEQGMRDKDWSTIEGSRINMCVTNIDEELEI